MLPINRLRVRKACITCKRRKIKCDGQNPCQNCIKHNIHCSYQLDTPKLVARNDSISDASYQSVPSLSSPWQCFSPHKYRFHRRHQNLLPFYLGNVLMRSLPQSVIDEHSLRPPRLQFYGWNMSGGHYLKQRQTTTSKGTICWQWDFSDPIQQNLVEKLVQFYFKNVNRFLSIVHEQAFWQQFKAGFVNRDPQGSSDLFEAILNLIVAIALRFSYSKVTDPLNSTPESPATFSTNECLSKDEANWIEAHSNLEETLFDYAYTVTTQMSFEWESFELIQSWLLMAFYLRTCHRQVSCWQALSRAVQMCNGMSLFLNKFPENHNAYDECRARNCYWACFTLDRLIGFQMGRIPELAPPGPQMLPPDVATDSWLSSETIVLYKLALIITDCQKRYGEELSIQEYQAVKSRLIEWYNEVGPTLIDVDLCTRQVILTYLDVRIALEIRSLFPFLDANENYSQIHRVDLGALPIDAPTLLDLVEQILNTFRGIVESGLFFRPWWLNLSLLFISSIICLILIQSGIQVLRAQSLLKKSFDIWQYIENSTAPNPPGMVTECLWCLKMLNHMFCQRLKQSAKELENTVGLDHANDSVNNNKFRQFGKVEKVEKVDKVDKETIREETFNFGIGDASSPSVDSNSEDLFAHLQWFDQWLDVNNLDTML
ncbi:LANO_0D04324g1_1 [Lachancea nothofagi CBS 11611]|uniref:LANO_0D04324g1_1 n=1 Tax=Lachancea nothofagi CBS 11611 TaxID=1266666 RepID=A0A1G4JGG0_9SACH|nr:LANO_0D04324g1_1 [Lachancea nothofagi CBS 11611]